MDHDDSDVSESVVVHSEGSGSVVVHDVPDDSGLSAPVPMGGTPSAAAAAVMGRAVRLDTPYTLGSGGVGGGGSSTGSGTIRGRVTATRRVPRPKPALRWSQVPAQSRANPAQYILNRYGRGSGSGSGSGSIRVAGGGGGGGAGGSGGVGPRGFGDSFDAFKLYVGDDGEMEMGDHLDGYPYEVPEDEDDMQQQLLLHHLHSFPPPPRHPVGDGADGGFFYKSGDDSSYSSSDDNSFIRGSSYAPTGEDGYGNSEQDDDVVGGRGWVIGPAMSKRRVSRRRRLMPKGFAYGPGGGVEQRTRKGRGKAPRRPQLRVAQGRLSSSSLSRGGSRETGGNSRMPSQSNRSPLHTHRPHHTGGGRSSSSVAASHVWPATGVGPGAHVAAGAAAYPNLPASLGALVLLSQGVPAPVHRDTVSRLRKQLMERQSAVKRDLDKRRQTRHTEPKSTRPPLAPASPRGASRESGDAPGTARGTARQSTPPPPLHFEDLNRSLGPATARLGAGASLSIQRSARQRLKDPTQQQPGLSPKEESVKVRGATHLQTSVPPVQLQQQQKTVATEADRAAAGPLGDATLAHPPQELRDPYTGVLLPSAVAPATEAAMPPVSLACAAGIPFFHDPTAPRPVAVAEVMQTLPYSLLPASAGSDWGSSREASMRASFSVPATTNTPATTYRLPSSMQHHASASYYTTAAGAMGLSPQQLRRNSALVYSSSLCSPRGPHAVTAPAVHFSSAAIAAHGLAAPPPYFSGAPVAPASSGATSTSLLDEIAARHERTETETYRDVRLSLTSQQGRRGSLPSHVSFDAPLGDRPERQRAPTSLQHSAADMRISHPSPFAEPSDIAPTQQLAAVLSSGQYRAPSALGGAPAGGQRQRWRPHGGGGGSSAAVDSVLNNGFAGAGGAPPPWRWLHVPQPSSAPFSACSSASGTPHRGSYSGAAGCSPFATAAAMQGIDVVGHHSSGGGARRASLLMNGSDAVPLTASAPPVAIELRGFKNACESNWAALTSQPASSVRGRVLLNSPPPPLPPSANAPPQLPLYPLSVAPYAAPRNPLEQNIRYNAWTADGVTASSGVACVVHVFTVTSAMLRTVYEYVAYLCVWKRERALRKRQQARERRMQKALAAGVLTRELQRCLRCPHCGIVGQVAKAAPSCHASHPHAQQQQPRASNAPLSLANQTRGLGSSLRTMHSSLRNSASAPNLVRDSPAHHDTHSLPQQPQHIERVSSSTRQPLSHISLPTQPHSSRTAPGARSSTAQPSAAEPLDVSISGGTVYAAPLPSDAVRMTSPTGEVEWPGFVPPAARAHSPPEPRLALPAIGEEDAAATTLPAATASSPRLATSNASTGALPPLPPMLNMPPPPPYVSAQPASLSQSGVAMEGSACSSGPPLQTTLGSAAQSQQLLLLQPHQHCQSVSSASSRFVPIGGPSTPPAAGAAGTPNKRRRSPTTTANAAATLATGSSGEGRYESQLEKSYGSREFSQAVRESSSQSGFQRYAVMCSSGDAAPSALLRVSDSQHPHHRSFSSHFGHVHAAPHMEREESEVRHDAVMAELTDEMHPESLSKSYSNSLGLNGLDSDDGQQLHEREAAAPAPSVYGPVRRAVMSPPHGLSGSLREAYLTPPALAIGNPASLSPDRIESTLSRVAGTGSLLSPVSTSSLPVAANTLPPMRTHTNSPTMVPTAVSVSGGGAAQTRTHGGGGGGGASSTSGNTSLLCSVQASKLTPAVQPLAASVTSLAEDDADKVVLPRDVLSESTSGMAVRGGGSAALARRYVCMSCHRDVIPRTSMVTMPSTHDEHTASTAGGSTAMHKDATDDLRDDDALGVLAFEDMLQDDTFVHALQTYLQESVMLPATRQPPPPRPPRPTSVASAAAATSGPVSGTTTTAPTRPVTANAISDSRLDSTAYLFPVVEGVSEASLTSPLQPPVHGSASVSAAEWVKSAGTVHASQVRLPAALSRGDGASATAAGSTAKERAAGSRQRHPTMQSPTSQPLTSPLSRLSSQSSSSSSSSVAFLSSVLPIPPAESGAGAAATERGCAATAAAAAPSSPLLRLSVPCCGLKVSVLEYVEPRTPSPPFTPTVDEDDFTARGETQSSKASSSRRKTGGTKRGKGNSHRRPPLQPGGRRAPPAVPRMREDAATRGLTQSALSLAKNSGASGAGRHGSGKVPAKQNGQLLDGSMDTPSRRARERRGVPRSESSITRDSPNNTGNQPSTTMMQDTDASKRHRVLINSRLHLDASSINSIWERVFAKNRNSVAAAMAAGRDKAAHAKKAKSPLNNARRPLMDDGTPAGASNNGSTERSTASPRRSSNPTPGTPHASPSGGGCAAAPSARVPQPLGLNLSTYPEASLVLKIELAYPRLPRGNVRQLLDEWVETCQPHPVLLEAVIRNTIYGVLEQLQTLHAAGRTHGSIKSTNVFPLWYVMEGTRGAGIVMPPPPPPPSPAPPPAANATNGERDRGRQLGEAVSNVVAESTGAASAPGREDEGKDRPGLREREAADDAVSREALTAGRAASTDAALSQAHDASQHQGGNRRRNSSTPTSASPSGTHHSSSMLTASSFSGADPLGKHKPHPASPLTPFTTQVQYSHSNAELATYRRSSAVAGSAAAAGGFAALVAADKDAVPMASSATAASGQQQQQQQRSQKACQSAFEGRQRPLSAASLATSTSSAQPPPLQPITVPIGSSSHFTSTVLLTSDALALNSENSGSGSGLLPFSPALGMDLSHPRRQQRGFGDRGGTGAQAHWRDGSRTPGSRRTRSAGGSLALRRHSCCSEGRAEDEMEGFVPLVAEVLTPALATAAAPASSCEVGSASNSASLPLMRFSTRGRAGRPASPDEVPPGPLPSMVPSSTSGTSRAATHHDVSAAATPFRKAGVPDPEQWMLDAVPPRYACGAQLLPPAFVVLPASELGAVGEAEKAQERQAREGCDAARVASPRAPERTQGSDGQDWSAQAGPTRIVPLPSSGPTGPVPRPKTDRCWMDGLLSAEDGDVASRRTSAAAAAGVSEADTNHTSDTLDPMQWSRQVLLLDNIGTRVETALRMAMTTLLTQHPPCPRRATQATTPPPLASFAPATREDSRAAAGAESARSSRPPAMLRRPPPAPSLQQRSDGGRDGVQRGAGGSNSVSPRARSNAASPRGRVPAHGGSAGKKALNAYRPITSHTVVPTEPLLFGVQESEYVPAPETIRSAADEAKALWRLWRHRQSRQQQQQQRRRRSVPFAPAEDVIDGADQRREEEEEEAEMSFVAARLAERASPATTLRNTLDPYPTHTAAADIWQLGMMALDLADGPAPTTWLKQRNPIPRLRPYPWSSYFHSFVSQCLQTSPDRRATAAELLAHPWFRVALVPQTTGGGCSLGRSYGGGATATAAAAAYLQPLARVSCVMGVDCLTKEEQEEWEAYDYTLLYANGEAMQQPQPSLTSPAAANNGASAAGAAASMKAAALGNNTSSSSHDNAAAGAGMNRTRAQRSASTSASMPISVGMTVLGGTDSAANASTAPAASNNLSAASGSRMNATIATTANNTTANAAAGATENEAPMQIIPSSVDLAQFFARLVTLQWRRQQQQQQQQLAMTAPSFTVLGGAAPGTLRQGLPLSFAMNSSSSGFAADARRGSAVLGVTNLASNTSFLELSAMMSSEEALQMLRQSPANPRYLHMTSPRHHLYTMMSPRQQPPPVAPPSSVHYQLQQQLDGTAAWGHHARNLSVHGGGHSSAGTASPPPGPAALSVLTNGGSGGSAGPLTPSSVSGPPPVTRMGGIPSAYVPLRDPRAGSLAPVGNHYSANGAAPAASSTTGFVTTGAFMSPQRRASGSAAGGAVSVTQQAPPTRQANAPAFFVGSARDPHPGLTSARTASDKVEAHWGDLSDAERYTVGEGGSMGRGSHSSGSSSSSTTTNSTSSSDDDGDGFSSSSSSSGVSVLVRAGEQVDRAQAAALAALIGRISPGGHSSSRSRSFMSSSEDNYLAGRGGGEVPCRGHAGRSPHGGAAEGGAVATTATAAATRSGELMDNGGAQGDRTSQLPGQYSGRRQLQKRMRREAAAGGAALPLHRTARQTRREANRRRHLLFSTIATALARLSAITASSSDSDDHDGTDDDSSSGSVSHAQTHPSSSLQWDTLTQKASDSSVLDWERRILPQRHATNRVSTRYIPLRAPYTYPTQSDSAESSSDGDGDDTVESECDSVGMQCDELLRCFSALQRGCPMAVSLWCVRALEQAASHPRTAACAARLLSRVERGVSGGAERRRLAWLASDESSSSSSASFVSHKAGDGGSSAAMRPGSPASNVPANTAAPANRVPPVLDTCPSSFQNYEMAKWLFSACQTLPRCV